MPSVRAPSSEAAALRISVQATSNSVAAARGAAAEQMICSVGLEIASTTAIMGSFATSQPVVTMTTASVPRARATMRIKRAESKNWMAPTMARPPMTAGAWGSSTPLAGRANATVPTAPNAGSAKRIRASLCRSWPGLAMHAREHRSAPIKKNSRGFANGSTGEADGMNACV